MVDLFCKYIKKMILPRWLVFLADTGITATAFLLAYILRLNIYIDQASFGQVMVQLVGVIFPVYGGIFLLAGIYRGILRHSSIEDAARLALSISAAMCAVYLVSAVAHLRFVPGILIIPYSVIFVHAALTSVMLMGFRLIVRNMYHTYVVPHNGYRRVLIFGAGKMGRITLGVLESDPYSQVHVLGFIDDEKVLIGKRLAGKPIYSEEYAFDKVIERLDVHEIIIAVNHGGIAPDRQKILLNHCLLFGVHVRIVPPLKDWIDGKLRMQQIRDVKIEDLLGRDPIEINFDKISRSLKNTVVLVTGAAGSIGSEIVRQLTVFEPKNILLLDQAETPLYDLQQELLSSFPGTKFRVVMASVADPVRMRHVFEEFRPQYVFNAAAYKHVPLMEATPYEAIRVNIGGTRLLADLSVEFGVKKFVMISTDKAVNPTNVMGASKRICEIYIQSLSRLTDVHTQFITTRFGNVLGSNGSVVPLFRKQIEAGGPVTVTHPDIIRYFMTIPEACQLVLEAGFMARGGEIFMFDMGEPVRIYELAVKMITLAGLKPEEEIPIQITGLRPGEKLFEELLADKENTVQTYHPKIRVAKVCPFDFEMVKNEVDSLLQASQTDSDTKLVARMKAIIPEFHSQNSQFVVLDHIATKEKKK